MQSNMKFYLEALGGFLLCVFILTTLYMIWFEYSHIVLKSWLTEAFAIMIIYQVTKTHDND